MPAAKGVGDSSLLGWCSWINQELPSGRLHVHLHMLYSSSNLQASGV